MNAVGGNMEGIKLDRLNDDEVKLLLGIFIRVIREKVLLLTYGF